MLISSDSSDNTVGFNYIGVGSDGTANVGNGESGVYVDSAPANQVGFPDMSGPSNVIGWNTGSGVAVTGAYDTRIVNNSVGVGSDGTTVAPNGEHGVSLFGTVSTTYVGGDFYSGEANVVSGNGMSGIDITGDSIDNTIHGNRIGCSADETNALGNGMFGISISDGPKENEVGSKHDDGLKNVIAHNSYDGIEIKDGMSGATLTRGNRVNVNAVYNNGGLSIDLEPDPGPNDPETHPYGTEYSPNDWMPYPVIWSATEAFVEGESIPGSMVFLYWATRDPGDFGEGKGFLAGENPVQADFDTGYWSAPLDVLPGDVVTAMAVDPMGNAGEFSMNVEVTGGGSGPNIDDVWPDRATCDDVITITGSGFGPGGEGHGVFVGSTGNTYEAPVLYWSETQIEARVPPKPFEGAVEVQTPYGSAWSEKGLVIYPSVHSIKPDGAGRWDAIFATVTGTNFDSGGDGENLDVWLSNKQNFRNIDGLVIGNPDYGTLQAFFTFLGDVQGEYDLFVRNTRTGETGMAKGAFTVGEGPEPPAVANVRIDEPADGSYPADGGDGGAGAQTVSVEASAESNVAPIDYVDISIDGRKVARDEEAPYTYDWDFSKESNGTHEITAAARDAEGNTGETLTTTHVYKNGLVPNPSVEWFLPEGSTAWGFETYVLIANPNPGPVEAAVELLKEQAPAETLVYTIPGQSRYTISLDDIAPNCDLSTRVTASKEVICERAMYWGDRVGGHDSIGTTRSAKEWHLAEGTTAWGFETWYLLANPGDEEANVSITCLDANGAETTGDFRVPPRSRKTVDASTIVPNADISATVRSDKAIAVERAMYWGDRVGGHDTIGVTQDATSWYLAEGATIEGFETWVLVENPGDGPASITANFLPATRQAAQYEAVVPPHARHTIKVSDVIPDAEVAIEVISDEPVICERAMYWDDRVGGHDTIGTPTPSSRWFMAEGTTAYGFEEWLLLSNPDSLRTAQVTVKMLEDGGGTREQQFLVPPRTRYSVSVNELVGEPPGDVSLEVTSNVAIVAERSMYWGDRIGGHVSVSCRAPWNNRGSNKWGQGSEF